MVLNCSQLVVAANIENIKWNAIDHGIALARQTHRKMLIDFTEDECPSCARMESLYKRADVVNWVTDNFVPVKCQPKKNSIDRSYFHASGGNGYPTTVVYDPASNIAKNFSGYVDDTAAFENEVVHLLLQMRGGLASTSVKTELDDEAVQACSGIIAANPNVESYDLRAATYYRLGRFADCVKDLRTLVAGMPQKFDYRRCLVLSLEANNQRDEAIKVATEATRDFPKSAWLFSEHGLLYAKNDETVERVPVVVDNSIALNSEDAAPHYYIATANNSHEHSNDAGNWQSLKKRSQRLSVQSASGAKATD
jgi:tetratricopeptide (TPR) repeat protein